MSDDDPGQTHYVGDDCPGGHLSIPLTLLRLYSKRWVGNSTSASPFVDWVEKKEREAERVRAAGQAEEATGKE